MSPTRAGRQSRRQSSIIRTSFIPLRRLCGGGQGGSISITDMPHPHEELRQTADRAGLFEGQVTVLGADV